MHGACKPTQVVKKMTHLVLLSDLSSFVAQVHSQLSTPGAERARATHHAVCAED